MTTTTPSVQLIYAGGTFGSHGTPLSPLPADVFLPILGTQLATHGYTVEILPNEIIKDSSTLTAVDFVAFYQQILHAYQLGKRQFVLITGTDSLSFLAAFLANALQDLTDISLVITGSMQPLFIPDAAEHQINPHSDAWANLSGALDIALAHTGVFVQFYHKTFDAKNTQKINSQIHDAFVGTPATLGGIKPSTDSQRIADKLFKLPQLLNKASHTRIQAICALPNDADQLAYDLSNLHLDTKAVILIGYGSGNLPSTPAIKTALDQLHDQKITVICTTMCAFGGVSSTYAAGAWQYAHGIIAGGELSIAAIYGQALWLSLNDQLTASNWVADQ